MKRTILVLAVSLFAAYFCTTEASAQTKVRVKFGRGSSSLTVRGTIAGYRYVDYILGAKAGQTLTGKLTSAEPSVEFVIFKPDMDNIDEMMGDTNWSGQLPVNGNYTIRVLMPRSQARRKTTATYRLWISIR